MTDIDDQLRAYAQRWRTAQPPAPQPVPAPHSAKPRLAGFEHPVRLGVIAATVAALIAAVAVYAATRHPSSTQVSTGSAPQVPVATAPLAFSAQPPPRMINLGASGLVGTNRWILFAGYLPTETPGGLGPGLCLEVAVTGSGVSHCDNPATTPSLTADVVPLKGDPSMLLIAGVTSAPAASFTVAAGTRAMSTPALTTTALLGLYFYVIQVPAADYRPSHGVTVEARAANGAGLLRNDPHLTATLQPLG